MYTVIANSLAKFPGHCPVRIQRHRNVVVTCNFAITVCVRGTSLPILNQLYCIPFNAIAIKEKKLSVNACHLFCCWHWWPFGQFKSVVSKLEVHKPPKHKIVEMCNLGCTAFITKFCYSILKTSFKNKLLVILK